MKGWEEISSLFVFGIYKMLFSGIGEDRLAEKIDYTVVNVIFDKLTPLIKAHGSDPSRVRHFAFYLLLIAAAMSDEVGISQEEFRALSLSAFEIGREPDQHNNNNTQKNN